MNNIFNLLRNPQQAIQYMLDKMSKNPKTSDIANYLNYSIQTGRNPKDVLQEGINNGTISRDTLKKFKKAYSQYGRFLPSNLKVSKQTFEELDNMFINNSNSSKSSSGGFRF